MTGTAAGLGTGRVVPRAPGAALRSEHPWLGPCQPAPPLLPAARSVCSPVNGNKEVFGLRARTTRHLQKHVPRLPGALPDSRGVTGAPPPNLTQPPVPTKPQQV